MGGPPSSLSQDFTKFWESWVLRMWRYNFFDLSRDHNLSSIVTTLLSVGSIGRESREITCLSRDYDIEVSHDFRDVVLSSQVITLLSLVFIGYMELEIMAFVI